MGFHYLESIFIFDNLVIIRGRLYRIHIYCILGLTCLNVSITVSCFMFVKNRCLLHCCFWSCTHISWGYLPSVDYQRHLCCTHRCSTCLTLFPRWQWLLWPPASSASVIWPLRLIVAILFQFLVNGKTRV